MGNYVPPPSTAGFLLYPVLLLWVLIFLYFGWWGIVVFIATPVVVYAVIFKYPEYKKRRAQREGGLVGAGGQYASSVKGQQERADVVQKKSLPEKTKRSICPRCGSPLRVVDRKDSRFMGCTSYPSCRYTRSLSLDEEIPHEGKKGSVCPRCGKHLRVVYWTGRRFIGWTGYSSCRYRRPL